MRTTTRLIGFLAILACMIGGSAPARAAVHPAIDCAAMRTGFGKIQDAPTRVLVAKTIPPAEGVPEICQLDGYISPSIGFQLSLPTSTWNGKYIQFGCGGMCGDLGVVKPACDILLRRNYACLVQDAGHRGSAADGKWALNNLAGKLDWGVRSLHVSAMVGKFLTEHFYGTPPKYAYFMGGSTGGRQALVYAQRFPWDFNGIVGQNPPIDEIGDGLVLMWNVLANLDANDRNILNADDARTLHAAVLRKCDKLDGVEDQVIGDPNACHFDPGETLCKPGQTGDCLSAAKVAVVRKIYGGPVNSAGEKVYMSSSPVGSELSWIGPIISPEGGPGNHYEFMNEFFRYMAFPTDAGPDWDIHKFDWDKDYKRFGINETMYSASNPDLRQFKANGGKFILTQSLADTSVFPQRAIDYYTSMVRYMGGVDQVKGFFRFFTVPGGFHNPGQNGAADMADFLSYIEAWVEAGKAPDVMIAAGIKDGSKAMSPAMDFPLDPANIVYTRPLYPYPLQARYKGKGDPNDAANFTAFDPTKH